MIAPIILSVLLGAVLVYAWAEYRRSPAVALVSSVASVVGLYFVWMPSHTTHVAEFVGIGRGADLILYLWVCISLLLLLNVHLKMRAQHELITAVARAFALAEARGHAPRQWRDHSPNLAPLTTEDPSETPRSQRASTP
jgi:hypothetical protein